MLAMPPHRALMRALVTTSLLKYSSELSCPWERRNVPIPLRQLLILDASVYGGLGYQDPNMVRAEDGN